MGTNGALDTMAIDIPFDALKIKSGGDGLLDVAFLPDGKAWAWAAAGRSSPRMTPADRGPRTSPPMTCRRTCTRSNSSAIEGTSSARAASCSLLSDYELRDNRDESAARRGQGWSTARRAAHACKRAQISHAAYEGLMLCNDGSWFDDIWPSGSRMRCPARYQRAGHMHDYCPQRALELYRVEPHPMR